MHRLGFAPDRCKELHARLRALPNVADELVAMTHFASSDDFEGAQTLAQLQAFSGITACMRSISVATCRARSAGAISPFRGPRR